MVTQYHYTNILSEQDLNGDLNSDLDGDFNEDLNDNLNSDVNVNLKINQWTEHFHHACLEKLKSRDFHKVVLNIYESLSNEEKSDKYIIKSFNHYIDKWHYTPNEAWSIVWINFGNYLDCRFPHDKYPEILKIYNCL